MDNGTHTRLGIVVLDCSQSQRCDTAPTHLLPVSLPLPLCCQPASLPASHTYHVMCHTMMNMLPFH